MASRTIAAARLGACAIVSALLILAGCGRVAPTAQPIPPPSPTPPAIPQTPGPTAPSPTPTASNSALPDPDKLNAALAKIPKKELGATSLFVMDATGQTIVSRSNKPLVPASTMKLVTAAATLDTLDQNTTFTTRVVRVDSGTIALVGGGDPMLTDAKSKSASSLASLQDLAKKTIAALGGAKKVKLVFDASLFSGSGWGAAWRDTWKPNFPRIGALVVDGGMLDPWRAAPDPAKAAADAFAKRLKAGGVTVASVAAGKAPAGGTTLASVDSAPLWSIVAHTVRTSNNLAAEVLARHLGLAVNGKGSFAGGSAAIKAWLDAHGWLEDGVLIDGGSGLSLKARLTSRLLTRVVVLVLNDVRYASIVIGLPVAGVSGTLSHRFTGKSEKAGVGAVHAKTGSLNDVATLAGYVEDKDGTVLAFAAMANKTGGHDKEAIAWLDRSASVLAGCGCR